MTYASGGLIQASDFNTFNGGTVANVSGQINTVWSTGTGNAGYGQTAISNVSIGDTISAGTDPGLGPVFNTQWRSLVSNLNRIRQHQTGSDSGITAPSYGGTITFFSTLSTQLTNAYNDRLTAATTGSTTTGTNDTWNSSVGATTALSTFRDCNIIFSSTDGARYFFNAGGRIAITYSAVSNAANARSNNMRDMINQISGFGQYRGYSNSGILGSGGFITVNNTNAGYYNATTTAVTFIENYDNAAPYDTSYVQVQRFYAGATTNGALGNQLVFRLFLYTPADNTYGGSVDITVTTRCDITYPSTTYLSNSWGTPTISYDSV